MFDVSLMRRECLCSYNTDISVETLAAISCSYILSQVFFASKSDAVEQSEYLHLLSCKPTHLGTLDSYSWRLTVAKSKIEHPKDDDAITITNSLLLLKFTALMQLSSSKSSTK